jgi:hypothetical protein
VFQPCITVSGGSYPTSPGTYFYVDPIRQTGTVAEGAAVTWDEDTNRFLAGHLGNEAPPVGPVVLVSQTSGRSVFSY